MIDYSQPPSPVNINDENPDPYPYFSDTQSSILLARRIQLALGSSILALIIFLILKSTPYPMLDKLYIYNTTKLFMFCSLCYFFGMVVVLFHFESFLQNSKYYFQPSAEVPDVPGYMLYDILSRMKDNPSSMALCGLEALINNLLYNIGYFFAILVSYNVYCVIVDDYRNFMKRIFRDWKIWVVLAVIVAVHLVPLLLMFVQDFQDEKYVYSYGPAGFKWEDKDKDNNRVANLILLCGMCSDHEIWKRTISAFNLYICPLVMFVFHSILLAYNQKKLNKIKVEDGYLNTKQQFLLKSGKLSAVVFSIQLVNFIKLILSYIIGDLAILIINFAFDTYPIFLLFFYLKYTRQKKGIAHGSSTILQQED